MSSHPSLSKSAKDAPQNQPSGWHGLHCGVLERPVPAIAQQRVARCHLLEYLDEAEAGLLEDLPVQRHIRLQTPWRQQLSMYRITVGISAYQASSERMLVQ